MAPLAHSILVTGSNRGIGMELVRQLVEMTDPPEHIFATCRNPDGPRGKALHDLADKHPNIHVVQLEVEDQSSVKAAVPVVESHLKGKGLNLLINNAGRNSCTLLLEDVDQQDMLSDFSTNVAGPIIVVKEFLPLLKRAATETTTEELSCRKAAIINVSSLIGSIGGFDVSVPPMYSYRSSKAALNMITICLSVELKKDGILCTSVHPGWVKTDMGTEKAPLTVQCSVQGILKVLANLSSSSTGAFLDWKGNSIPW
ncbi:C-signal-like [Rhineura floridana]|uniref:C-signal-like n=1 Tax=Rhineura floridana TaxID=261503 RepID=UPI002AC83C9A|nr:C-signal-like [Rhineura floridana]